MTEPKSVEVAKEVMRNIKRMNLARRSEEAMVYEDQIRIAVDDLQAEVTRLREMVEAHATQGCHKCAEGLERAKDA